MSLLILTVGCVVQKLDVTNSGTIVENISEKINSSINQDNMHSKNNDPVTSYFTIGTGVSFIFLQVRSTTNLK